MEERVYCSKCGASILIETFQRLQGNCKPCFNKVANIKQPIKVDVGALQEWELKRENGHSLAKELLKDDFFWSIADENSPLGNDDGADTLHSYQVWLKGNPTINRNVFLNKLLAGWEVKNDKWDLLSDRKIKNEMVKDEFSFFTRDNVVIALAFSQIVLEGKIDSEIKQKALWALERQQNNAVLDNWRNFKEERLERLNKMKKAIENF